VSSGAPDLFVICKSCGSEVSPYITECPYCGNRLRKRAPKLDRDGRPKEPSRRRRRRSPAPSLGPLKRGEIPGIRADAHPYATIALVAASLVLLVLTKAGVVGLGHIVVVGPLRDNRWQIFTAPFAYDNSGYAFVALLAIAIFGWRLELRHGPAVVLALFIGAGVSGAAVALAVYPLPEVSGGNAAALALLAAWAAPDLVRARAGSDYDGDLLGAGALGAILLATPFARPEVSWLAGVTGGAIGALVGLGLQRVFAAD
jgi:hypothetical protein